MRPHDCMWQDAGQVWLTARTGTGNSWSDYQDLESDLTHACTQHTTERHPHLLRPYTHYPTPSSQDELPNTPWLSSFSPGLPRLLGKKSDTASISLNPAHSPDSGPCPSTRMSTIFILTCVP